MSIPRSWLKIPSLLGSPTLSVGKIIGGTQPNAVPDECTIDLDRRTIPGESEASVKKRWSRPSRQRARLPSFCLSRPYPASSGHRPRPSLVRSFLRAAGKRKPTGVPYFTDASPIATGGTPALVFGPGTSPRLIPTTSGSNLNRSNGPTHVPVFSVPCPERKPARPAISFPRPTSCAS